MKFLNILNLLLLGLLAYTSAQRCSGSPRTPSCTGDQDVGRSGVGCVRRAMWQYSASSRQCHRFVYQGCGGNNNRWCTRGGCELRCRRR